MPLLRLETDELAPSRSRIESLTQIRDDFVDANGLDFEDQANRCPRLPDSISFFSLPEQQLYAYESHRELSELGHVFRIANGLHDFIDAIVVVGSSADCLASQTLAGACCDPFHNEQTRADRGSKPRLYFADEEIDNDGLHSLTERLRRGGYGDTAAESRWGVIVVEGGESRRRDDVRDHVLALIEPVLASTPESSRDTMVTFIGREQGSQESEAAGQRNNPLRIPPALSSAGSILTPSALLPAAFLGLDCIQFLVGAAAINENFRTQPFEKNIVLRYIEATEDHSERFRWWVRSLSSFEPWIRQIPRSVVPAPGRSVTHVKVDADRTDPIELPGGASCGDKAESFVDARRSDFEESWADLSAAGTRQSCIHLPVVDTHALGQFTQLMLLAGAIRGKLNAE